MAIAKDYLVTRSSAFTGDDVLDSKASVALVTRTKRR